jgi:hypothetical protein
MNDWVETLIYNTVETGFVATIGTTLMTAACGQAENGKAAAPINAISHIAWGDEAARQDDLSMKYTATGLGLNAAAMGAWAGIYEAAFGKLIDKQDVVGTLLGGAAVSAAAYVIDYYVVPKRFTPGFEKRLSGRSMFAIYTALALSLGFGRFLVESARR